MLKLKILIRLVKQITHKNLIYTQVFIVLINIVLAFNANAIVSITSSEMLKEAIVLRESGESREAIKILESLIVQFKSHKRIHLELLVNYIKLEQVNNAKASILKLESLTLSKQEKKNISILKTRVKKLERKSETKLARQVRKHKFSTQTTVFAGIDEFTSSLSLYDFFDFEDIDELGVIDDYDNNYLEERNDDVDEKDKISYSAFQAKLSHNYISGKAFNFLSIQSTFNWKNNITLYQKSGNETQAERYNQYKVDSNYQIFRKDKWLFGFRLRARSHSIDGKNLLTEKGAQLSLSFPMNEGARIKLGIERREKSFTQSIDALNADVLTPWIEYSMKFYGHYKAYVGSRYRKNNAKDEFNSYNNLNYYASLRYYHSNQLSAYLTWNDNELNFDIDDPNIVNWGQEDKSSIALGVKYQFNKSFSAGIKLHSVTKNLLLYDVEKTTEKWKRIETFISYRF